MGISTVTKTSKQFGDFYRPLAPRPVPYIVRVSLPPPSNATQTFSVTVPFTGAGAALHVVFP